MNAHVEPLMAAVLNSIAMAPLQSRELMRGAYVTALKRQDWSQDCSALVLLQREYDADSALWNEHAPEAYRVGVSA